jgi:hypothetical protein
MQLQQAVWYRHRYLYQILEQAQGYQGRQSSSDREMWHCRRCYASNKTPARDGGGGEEGVAHRTEKVSTP